MEILESIDQKLGILVDHFTGGMVEPERVIVGGLISNALLAVKQIPGFQTPEQRCWV